VGIGDDPDWPTYRLAKMIDPDPHGEEALANARVMEVAPEMLEMLKVLEWVGSQRGQGTGPMGSGGDGRLVSACPLCRGINPKDPGRIEFIASAHGHQPSCKLHAVLVKAEGRDP
jgi:hypothetical protein